MRQLELSIKIEFMGLPSWQRKLIDELERYDCPKDLLEAIKREYMTPEQVENFRRNGMRMLNLKDGPAAHLREKNARPRRREKARRQRFIESTNVDDGRPHKGGERGLFETI